MLFASLSALLLVAAPPRPFVAGPSVEGVSEYGLPNGLRVLLVPDPSSSTVTVNLTVLVGSRHEGYGEKGMAHLLEHLLFKGSPRFPDPKKVLDARGAQWNGMTSEDRTVYFEALPATEANLELALRLEADRLVNAFVAQRDLDTEMTVVRNEFEATENDGAGVLRARVRAAALPWHNYGRAIIGVEADITRVPIERLKDFYRRFYQPDNAVLVVSGRFDEARALRLVAATFGRIPRPARRELGTFTTEPIQDGERWVSVRRVGGTPLLEAVWRVPAVSAPDYPALMVLQGVLGDQPQGRLHRALVEGKKASAARCDLDELKEPGLFDCAAFLEASDAVAEAKSAMLGVLESPGALSDAEVTRARDGWLSQYEQGFAHTETLAQRLSEAAGLGDWRLVYLVRDRLHAVTRADVERVWATYLKPQNRTMGEYVPTAAPDRAEIPPAMDPMTALAGFVGGPAVQQGEAFDATPRNLAARMRRTTLDGGAQLLLVPKKTRAQAVSVALELRLGTRASLAGQQAVAALTAALLGRGTTKRSFSDFRTALERLKSELTVHGQGQVVSVVVHTRRAALSEVLGLLGEALRAPALDATELAVLKKEVATSLAAMRDEPQALGANELDRAVAPLPPEHVLAVLPVAAQLTNVGAVTVEQVRRFYARFYGAQAAAVAVVGDFESAPVEAALASFLGGWRAPEPYERIVEPFVRTVPASVQLVTPDRANAWMGAGAMVEVSDSHPDYPALLVAAVALGGSPSARLFTRLREERGLSYGAYAMFQADASSERALFTTSVSYAPQNLGAVEAGLREELLRWPTLGRDELEHARRSLLEARRQSRGNDDELASLLAGLATLGRGMDWEASLDERLAAVTPEAANAAVRRHVDPSRLVWVKAGDFKAVAAPR